MYKTKTKARLKMLLGCCAAALIWGCPSEESNQQNTNTRPLTIGFIPSENMTELQQNTQPLVMMMSQKLKREIRPFVATDYTGVVEAFRAGKLDAAFLSPASYVMAKSEADVKVILKAQRGDLPYYYAIIFTHQDSGVHNLQDLKNKSFAFSDSLSTAGYIFPLKMFKEADITPQTDFENLIFSGGHDATVLAVYNQKVAGGATYANDKEGKKAAWVHLLKPEESKKLKVLAVSDPIPSDNICVSKDLPEDLAKSLSEFFVGLSQDEKGKALVKNLYRIDKFVPATDADYSGIRQAFEMSGIQLKKELAPSTPPSTKATH